MRTRLPAFGGREARWRFSAIFDKVGSSGIVKVFPYETFGFGISKGVGDAKCRPRCFA